MASLNFPSSPSTGATYTAPNGGVWSYNGLRWLPPMTVSADNVSGIVSVSKGGTGLPSVTANKIIKGNSSSALAVGFLDEDSSGNVSVGGQTLTLNSGLRLQHTGSSATISTLSGKGSITVAVEGTSRLVIDTGGGIGLMGNVFLHGNALNGMAATYRDFHGLVSDYGNVTGATSVSVALGTDTRIVPTGNTTITFTGIPASGKAAYWTLEIDGPGANTVSFAQTITWVGGAAPTIQTGTKQTVLGFRTRNGGSKIFGWLVAADA